VNAPGVICSILERDLAAARRGIRRAPSACGLVEIRGDHLRGEEIVELVREARRPVVVAVRGRLHGGGFDGTEEARCGILRTALEAGARFVDVEHQSAAAGLAAGERGARVILSAHGAPCDGDTLVPLYRQMARSGAAVLKIVPRAEALAQVGAVKSLLKLAADERRRLVCFADGPPGAVTRLLACAWGSWATYGAARRGAETGCGQFAVRDLLEAYAVHEISGATRLFALVGAALRQSPSPAMHRAGYLEAGLDARYLTIETERFDELLPFLEPRAPFVLGGLAVTMPLKEQAARRCEAGDAVAAAAGAVNTVVVESGGMRGFNTDGPAAVDRIRRHLDPAGRAIAVVGAGGTARAIGVALRLAGARVTLFNRGRERARRAARETGLPARRLDELGRHRWEVLVNATPLGREDERVLPPGALAGRLVLDAVYRREPTPLVREAASAGLGVIDGFELLCAQAERQFERFTGRRVGHDVLRAAGMQWLSGAAA